MQEAKKIKQRINTLFAQYKLVVRLFDVMQYSLLALHLLSRTPLIVVAMSIRGPLSFLLYNELVHKQQASGDYILLLCLSRIMFVFLPYSSADPYYAPGC